MMMTNTINFTSKWLFSAVICLGNFLLTTSTLLSTSVMPSTVVPLTFVREPPNLLDFSNTTGGRLDCVADGTPKPSVTWTYSDGKVVADVPSLRHAMSNGSLHFMPFMAQEYRQDVHAAVYRCRASNTQGIIVSRDVRVRAVVLQIYEAQVYDEFVIKGNTAVLKCHIPTFVADYVTVTSWRQDGSFIYPSTNEGAKYAMMPTGELHITDVQLSDAYTAYRCHTKHRLTNEERPSAASGRLFVTYPLGSVPPRITDSKVSLTVREGHVAVLPCVAQGYPLPEVTWFLKGDDDKLVPIRAGNKYRVHPSGLRIEQVAIRDAGVYVCVANNTVGSEKVETTLQLIAPLSVFIQPSRRVVDLGHSASFHCVTSGLPVTSLIWLKNGKPLFSDKNQGSRMREVLQFERVEREDQGLYQCLINSDYDSAQAAAELKLGDILPVFHYVFPENILNPEAQVSLKCVTSGSPQPEVHWLLDGVVIGRDSRISIDDSLDASGRIASYLNISSVRTEDGGNYACVARNKAGKIQHTARLNIYGRPFIRILPKISAVAGQDVVVTCPATGYPLSSISWERGGRSLPLSHHQVVFPNGTLQVKGVQRSMDAGKYTCVVRNAQGDVAKRDFEVMILVPPHIIPFSFMDEYMLEGMLARITCVVSRGDLPLGITWIKDGRIVTSDLGVTVRAFDEYSVVLTINSVTSKHNGNYTCMATNAAGTENHTAQLVVNVPPRWVVEPQDVEVLAGNRVLLNCQVQGFPAPVIEWMKAVDDKPGEYKRPYVGDPNVLHFENGSLLLNKARPSDAGQYLCRASNGVGAPLGLVIKVHVQVPVHFEIKSRNQTARRSDTIQLECEAKGETPINMDWFINGMPLKFESLSRFSRQDLPSLNSLTSEVHIVRADRRDTATYTCLATNKYGRDELVIQLTITEPPEPPSNLKASDKSSRSITLSWAAPFDGNSVVSKYIVQYKHTSSSWHSKAINFTVPGTETVTTISYLQPSASYHVRVLAINGLGSSAPSDVIGVTTLEEAPAGPPLDIKADSIGTYVVRVTWKSPKPDLWNGQILGYYVGYRLYESSDPYTFETVETVSNSQELVSVNLTSLKKFTRYSVIVQAYNHVGTSPRSDELIVLTSEDVPSSPPSKIQCSALSSQSLHVSWDGIANDAINGVLQGYKVYYHPVEEWYDKSPEVKITSGLKTVLSGLGKYTNYSVQILGFTRVGDGVKSLPSYCITNEDVPESPGDIKVAAMSSDSVLVTWKEPLRPNGLVTKYTVYKRTTDNDKEDIDKYVMPATQLYYETNELRKGKRYEFWVTASTSLGEGQSTRVVVHSSAGSVVPAKVMSFADKLSVAWKSELILPCKAVGVPTPSHEWKFKGEVVSSFGRWSIENDKTLVVHNTQVSDSGTYSCKASNNYGSDEINYVVVVQVPPSPPVLTVISATYHSLTVRWKRDTNDNVVVIGYYLHYKRDFGEWERIFMETDKTSHSITDLDCGSRYHLYITAVNNIGEGNPSEVVTTRTEGLAPVMPRKHAFIRESSTFVTLHLDSWVSGCAILYFVVHYKLQTVSDWRLVSNNVLLQQKEFIIPDLVPATWYHLKVTAHNNAGSTIAEYTFATRTSAGDALPEMSDGVEVEHNVPFYYNLITMIVSISFLLVTVVIVVIVCFVCRKRTFCSQELNEPPHPDARPRLLNETTKIISNSSSNYLLNNGNRQFNTKPGPLDTPTSDLSGDISPYATSQIPGCYIRDTRTLNQRMSQQVYPPLRDLQEVRDGTYPGTRKHTLQRLQQCPLQDHYCDGYTTELNHEDNLRLALTRDRDDDYGSTQQWMICQSPTTTVPEHNVPDLLDHGLESNSSVVSSPDLERRRPPQHRKRSYEVTLRRRNSLESGSDYATQETSFTFIPVTQEVKLVPYRTNDFEFSDTESERDILNRKKLAAFQKTMSCLNDPSLSVISPWNHH